MSNFSAHLIIGICFVFSLYNSNSQERSYKIFPTSEQIVIDGELNEILWNQLDDATNFTQKFPNDSIPSINETIVKLTYNDQFLYLSAICHLNEDEKFQANTLFRDFDVFQNDSFIFLLDTYADGLNAFSFEVTPFGSQGERLVSNGGTNEDDSDYNWENKWFSAIKRSGEKWIVEMAIPFKTLNFKSDINEWRINFIRHNRSANTFSSWFPIPVNMNIVNLNYMGNLIWEKLPIKGSKTNYSIIPNVTTTFSKDFTIPGSKWTNEITPSLDIKLKLGSSLNIDATINPDFSQIEVDRQQLNIGRFELFFPERRQFFLENSDLFANFGNNTVRPFFSRRIGITRNANEEFDAVPLLGGIRLSGKLGTNSRIGLMNVQTDETTFRNQTLDSTITRSAQNYLVAAYQHQVFKRSTASALIINRQSTSNGSINEYDRLIGGQFEWISTNNKWSGNAFYFHNFQEPVNDFSYGVSLQRSSQHFGMFTSFTHIGNNFSPETGFVPRVGVNRIGFSPFYIFRPKNSKINNIDVFFDTNHTLSHSFKFLDSNIFTGTFINMSNTSSFLFVLNNNYTFLLNDFDPSFSDSEPLPQGTEYFYPAIRMRYRTDQRKFLSNSLQLEYGKYFNGRKFTLTSTSNIRWQPYLEFSTDFIFNDLKLDQPHGRNSIFLIRPQIRLSLKKNLFITFISQYNSLQNNIGNNFRLQWRFRTASDLFLVYTDNYFENFAVKNRGISIKFIYWI